MLSICKSIIKATSNDSTDTEYSFEDLFNKAKASEKDRAEFIKAVFYLSSQNNNYFYQIFRCFNPNTKLWEDVDPMFIAKAIKHKKYSLPFGSDDAISENDFNLAFITLFVKQRTQEASPKDTEEPTGLYRKIISNSAGEYGR